MSGIEDLLRRRRELLEEIDGEIRSAYSRAVVLMFTDIVGSTEYYERHGDIAGRQMVQTHNDMLFPLITAAGGKIIKTIGDSIMASFDDPCAALDCAVRMQERLREHNRGRPEPEQIRVRMGLHYGEAVADERDLFGDAVNTAARVESLAKGGEILISGELAEQALSTGTGSAARRLVELGPQKVKGRQRPVIVYALNWEDRDPREILAEWQARCAVPQGSGAGSGPTARVGILVRGAADPAREAQKQPSPPARGNPYLNRVMLPHPDLFFGRQALLRRVFSRLGSDKPQSVSIVGERRIGKSSLLNMIRSPRTRMSYLEAPQRLFFALIDLQQLRGLDEKSFYVAVFAELARQSAGVLQIDAEPSRAGFHLLCETLADHGLALVLLLDEFECVTKNPAFDASFYALLRSLANSTSLAFVTASARPLKDMCVSHQIADSPFFNIFATQHLGLFTDEEARALIAEPSAARGVRLDPLADTILAMGGRYPFFLQIACAAWFDYLEAEGGKAEDFAGRPPPREVTEAFREEATPHFEYVWETLPPEERSALAAMTRGGEAAGAAVESLQRKGYATEVDGRPAPFSVEFGRFVERQG